MSKNIATFFVPGIPSTSGSKKGFMNKKTGGVIIAPANSKKQKQWMSDVKTIASKSYSEGIRIDAIELIIIFTFMRPKSHYGTGRNSEILKPSAIPFPTVKPDLTKLVRCTEDALKGVVWKDDSQVVIQSTMKRYGDKPGAEVIINRI